MQVNEVMFMNINSVGSYSGYLQLGRGSNWTTTLNFICLPDLSDLGYGLPQSEYLSINLIQNHAFFRKNSSSDPHKFPFLFKRVTMLQANGGGTCIIRTGYFTTMIIAPPFPGPSFHRISHVFNIDESFMITSSKMI